MQIELNGARIETAAATLAALIEERGFEAGCVATAVNGEFVAIALRAATPLAEGAKIEVLTPMQGG